MTRWKPSPIRRWAFRRGAGRDRRHLRHPSNPTPPRSGRHREPAGRSRSSGKRATRPMPTAAGPTAPSDPGRRHPDGTSVPAAPICNGSSRRRRSAEAGDGDTGLTDPGAPTPAIPITGCAGDVGAIKGTDIARKTSDAPQDRFRASAVAPGPPVRRNRRQRVVADAIHHHGNGVVAVPGGEGAPLQRNPGGGPWRRWPR